MATPLAKGGTDVIGNPSRVRAAANGEALQFASLLGFGDARGSTLSTEYIAVRGSNGSWQTHGITPLQEATSYIPDSANRLEPRYFGEFSSDLSQGVFLAKKPLTDAPNVAHTINLYRRSDLLVPGAGAYQLLTDAQSDQGTVYQPSIQPWVAGASADFSHILFESRRSLVAETTSMAPNSPKLYEWIDGVVRFVGFVPLAPDTECGAGGPTCVPVPSQAGQGALTATYTLGTISQDGRRAIFTVPDSRHAGQLYLRDDQGTLTTGDDVTVQINASERTTPDPQQSARFWAASSDGTKVFFTTAEKLTDEDPNDSSDLYRYDLAASVGSRLMRISVDSEPGDNQANDFADGHNVAGALGASTSGDTVYFAVTGGQLIAGAPTNPPVGNGSFLPGDARIYRWHDGTLREVGGINRSLELEAILGQPGWPRAPGAKYSRVTPNGRYLIFVTQGTDQLLSRYGHPEYPHGDTCAVFSANEACQEVYFYDAEANDGQGELQCASCNPTGAPATSNALLFMFSTTGPTFDTSHLSHPLSDDGRYVFFDSGDQLVPADKNSAVDTYEYDTVSRQLSLLSSGTGVTPQIFLDASADGHDVFFLSRAQLRSEDHDQGTDIYDARIGGTVDPGPPITESCDPLSNSSCQGPPSPAPSASTAPLTTRALGHGNLNQRAAKHKKHKPKKHHRHRKSRQRHSSHRRG